MGLLDGIRILELAHWAAGPTAGAILGDMGAEVISIEEAGRSNPTREMHSIGSADYRLDDGRSMMSEAVMRNKSSLKLDYKSLRGRKILHGLVRTSDAFQTNLRKSALGAMGLDYDSLRRLRGDLIYSRISAYGPSGPLAEARGFDFLMQGFAGIMKAGGEPGDQIPSPPLQLLVDYSTGLLTAYSIVAALYHRERTGEGQEVHTSLLSVCLNLFNVHGMLGLAGREATKHSRLRPGNPLRNYYLCADGRWLIMAHNPPERYWPRFKEVLELDESASLDWEEERLVEAIASAIARRSLDAWLKVGRDADLIFAPVNDSKQVYDHLQVRDADLVDSLTLETGATMKLPAFPTRFAATPVRPLRRGSPPGLETKRLLRDLGLGSQEISDLFACGTVE